MSCKCHSSYQQHRSTPHSGFTLLELLVAISIFSLIAAAGYSGLTSLSRSLQVQRTSSAQLAEIQWAIARLDRDLTQAINRPQRTENGLLPAFIGDNRQLNLVTLIDNQLLQQPLSDERPLRWQWQQPVLERQIWQLPDRLASNAPLATTQLLEGVEVFEFRYLDSSGRWLSHWNSAQQGGILPRAVQVRLQINGFGEIRRLLELPGKRS